VCFSAAGVVPGVIPGVVPGVTTRTIEVMPSSLGDRENCGDSVDRPVPPEVDRRLSTVEVPSQPPVLTSGAARALVRILLRASRSGSDATVPTMSALTVATGEEMFEMEATEYAISRLRVFAAAGLDCDIEFGRFDDPDAPT